MGALPRHKTTTTEVAWDGPANEKLIKTPVTHKVADAFWAWQDPSADSTTKAAYSLPHHEVSSDGVPGAANVKGCTAAIGVLNGAMGGSTIPAADKHAVWEHLQAHLQDAGMKTSDVPELKGHHRPGQEARTLRSALRGTRETRMPVPGRSQFELRETPNGTGGTNLVFTGYACITGSVYEMEDWLGPWTEQVEPGAFAATLRQGADVAFLLNHEGMTLARTKPRTLLLAEDSQGLHVQATLDPANMYVQAMRSAVDRGDLDEMSMAFRAMNDYWNDDYTDRIIKEIALAQGDVSLVNYAANGATAGTVSMRHRGESRGGPSATRFLAAMREVRELREGKQFSSASMGTLQQVLAWCSDADDAMDQAQIVLAGLLGVPNPDDDGQWDGLSAANAGGTGDDGDAPPAGQGQPGPNSALATPLVLDDYKAKLAALAGRR